MRGALWLALRWATICAAVMLAVGITTLTASNPATGLSGDRAVRLAFFLLAGLAIAAGALTSVRRLSRPAADPSDDERLHP